ncbi:NADPH quinone reductase MdaB, partial [Campylobacter coli]|nr:NADPH quinone reductase MdaB [Campylobacter coli]
MKNILLLNGAKSFGHSGGKLNDTLHEVAKESLLNLGLKVDETYIDKGYDIENEVAKILNADAIIYQMPGWWMGEPWIVKKYIDEVFTAGHGKFYANDGRSREDASKKYGSGGLV